LARPVGSQGSSSRTSMRPRNLASGSPVFHWTPMMLLVFTLPITSALSPRGECRHSVHLQQCNGQSVRTRFAQSLQWAQAGLGMTSHSPPVGAIYSKRLWIPLLGQQAIVVHILPDGQQRLELSGAINLDETFSYTVDGTGRVLSNLPPRTQRILKRFGTSFRGARYLAHSDSSIFTMKPFVGPAIHVRLERQHAAAITTANVADALECAAWRTRGFVYVVASIPRRLLALLTQLQTAATAEVTAERAPRMPRLAPSL